MQGGDLMSKTINSDLIRGNINTIILKSLYGGDRYGYDIIKEIEEKSHGQYILKQPTLYSCLKRLESQGFITSYWGEQSNSNGGRRKYYTLTDLGREVFVQNQDEYEYSRTIIDQLISERDYDLDSVERQSIEEEGVNSDNSADISECKNEKIVEAVSDTETANETVKANTPEAETVEASEASSTLDTAIKEDNEPKSSDTVVTDASVTDTGSAANDEIEEKTDTALRDFFGYDETEQTAATDEEIDAMLSGAAEKKSYSDNVSVATTETAPKRSFGETYFDSDDTASSQFSYGSTEQYGFAYDDENSSVITDSAQQSTAQMHEAATIEPTKNASPEFLSYDTEVPYTQYHAETYKRPPTDDNYRSMLEGLVPGYGGITESESAKTDAAATEDIATESPMTVKEKIQVRNFGKLSQSIRNLGDEVKIRTPDSKAAREYNKQYYYYSNKLLLFQYGILFLIMLLESFIVYISIKTSATVELPHSVALYVCSILFCLAFPITAGILYLSDPFKRKRIDFNLKSSMIFRTIIMFQLILIIYAINVYCGMPLGGSNEYLLSMILPCVLTTNLPISSIIFRCLYRSKNFAVD